MLRENGFDSIDSIPDIPNRQLARGDTEVTEDDPSGLGHQLEARFPHPLVSLETFLEALYHNRLRVLIFFVKHFVKVAALAR